jgi:tellurium resistance protein TerZ
MEDFTKEAPESNFPAKGEHIPLIISETGKRRVHIGVGWDVREEEERKRKLLGGGDPLENTYVQINVEQYDMDLVALIFDAEGNAVDAVSPDLDEVMDQSGHIYHSGDNDTGRGDYDDEVISVELTDMPDHIHHIVFLITAQSGHTFERILDAEARVADGKTNEDRLKIKLGEKGKAGADKTACIFARIYREGDGWFLHHIQEYRVDANIEDWIAEITPYLSK